MNPNGVGARALRYWETRQAAVANNLANASTPGFKAERVFARLLEGARAEIDSSTDFSAGTVRETGGPLDLALVGDGFLVVDTPAGRRWIRGGSLSLDADGTLRDAGGRPVLGEQGPIVLPPGQVEVTGIGEVLVDGEVHARLLLQRPASGATPPTREGATLWAPPQSVQRIEEGEIRIRQGHLEESNVDPVGALVEMIEIQRAFTAVQRTMVSRDDVMQTITSEIGRIGG